MGEELFNGFVAENEIRMNIALNKFIWLCSFVGPLVAIGIYTGLYNYVTYFTAEMVTLAVILLATIHTAIIHRKPYSRIAKYLLFLGIQFVIVLFSLAHARISISYFLVAMLSLMFLDRKAYYIASAICYISMLFCSYITSVFWSADSVSMTRRIWLSEVMGAYTVEFVIMFIAGCIISFSTIYYIETAYSSQILNSAKDTDNYSDHLTGLWNEKYLSRSYDKYVVIQNHTGALILIEIDNLKEIKDKFGSSEGDRALITFGNILASTFRLNDNAVISRYGDDKFAVLVPQIESEEELIPCIERLQENIHRTLQNDNNLNTITVSIGAAFGIKNGIYYHEVFSNATKALRFVKENGRNGYQVFHK